MTFLFVICIIVCFAIIGFKLASYYTNRKKFYFELKNLLSCIELDVNFTQQKLKDIFEKNISNLSSADLIKITNRYCDSLKNRERPDQNIFKEIKIIKTEEQAVLLNFFTSLGRYDCFSQTKEIQNYQKIIESYYDDSAKESKKYAGLYVKLSVIFGVLVCLIIL